MAGPIKNVIKPNFSLQGNRGVQFPLSPVECTEVIGNEWIVQISSNVVEEPLPDGWTYIIMENSTNNYERPIVTEWPQAKLGMLPYQPS